jgi:hypothetical protein
MRSGGSYEHAAGCRFGRQFAWVYFALARWSTRCTPGGAAWCHRVGFPDVSGFSSAEDQSGADAKRRVQAPLKGPERRESFVTLLDLLTKNMIKIQTSIMPLLTDAPARLNTPQERVTGHSSGARRMRPKKSARKKAGRCEVTRSLVGANIWGRASYPPVRSNATARDKRPPICSRSSSLPYAPQPAPRRFFLSGSSRHLHCPSAPAWPYEHAFYFALANAQLQ